MGYLPYSKLIDMDGGSLCPSLSGEGAFPGNGIFPVALSQSSGDPKPLWIHTLPESLVALAQTPGRVTS